MSDLQKKFQRAKLPYLPREPPMPPSQPPTHQLSELTIVSEYGEDEEGINTSVPPSPLTDDSSSASSASSTATIRPIFSTPAQPRKKPTFEPIPWQAHFSHSLFLTSPTRQTTHHVYLTPPLSKGPLFVTHHGAGSSGLSFALMASAIRKLLPAAGILSPDARGHGETTTDNDSDLSLATLSSDLVEAIELTAQHCGWGAALPGMVLVGHSLGGAVVVDVAHSGRLGGALLGYSVLDVVEGSAIDALQSMQTYLLTRPTGFGSLSQAIEWHTRSRTLRNPTSARISVPALLTADDAAAGAAASPPSRPWKWRTDLAATQPFWEGWFVGLSRKFLDCKPAGKLLILAGTDRLDKELIIGQMQGKYQLLVMPEIGHFVHEDAPEKTACALVEFYKRNDRSALVLPPKVGDMYRPVAAGVASGAHFTSI